MCYQHAVSCRVHLEYFELRIQGATRRIQGSQRQMHYPTALVLARESTPLPRARLQRNFKNQSRSSVGPCQNWIWTPKNNTDAQVKLWARRPSNLQRCCRSLWKYSFKNFKRWDRNFPYGDSFQALQLLWRSHEASDQASRWCLWLHHSKFWSWYKATDFWKRFKSP